MNYFDQLFFAKYLRENEELLFVCHKHIVLIIDDVLLLLFFGLLLPGFFYYNDSFSLRSIPFAYFEAYIFALYVYVLYKMFDWYNDVWLVTDQGLIDIDWDVFARSVDYVDYHDIKGAEIETGSFLDSFLKKGDIIVHSHGDDDGFVLE